MNPVARKSLCAFFLLLFLFISSDSFSAPQNTSEKDERIEQSIKDSYVFNNFLNKDKINVDSENGDVTLTGTVAEDFHKTLAEDTVKNVSGVKSVNNQLVVAEEGADALSDEWISLKVKTTLLFHTSVSGIRTKVYVEDGIVTLTGEAESQAEKDLAAKFAKDVSGVKDVINQMTVNDSIAAEDLGKEIDDASITAQVKAALFFHTSTSMLNTTVKTEEGVVTLTGKAKNAAEKDLVTEIAKDVKGVKKVVNNISVEANTGLP
jgi:osmotically-inducible protein OsmY